MRLLSKTRFADSRRPFGRLPELASFRLISGQRRHVLFRLSLIGELRLWLECRCPLCEVFLLMLEIPEIQDVAAGDEAFAADKLYCALAQDDTRYRSLVFFEDRTSSQGLKAGELSKRSKITRLSAALGRTSDGLRQITFSLKRAQKISSIREAK